MPNIFRLGEAIWDDQVQSPKFFGKMGTLRWDIWWAFEDYLATFFSKQYFHLTSALHHKQSPLWTLQGTSSHVSAPVATHTFAFTFSIQTENMNISEDGTKQTIVYFCDDYIVSRKGHFLHNSENNMNKIIFTNSPVCGFWYTLCIPHHFLNTDWKHEHLHILGLFKQSFIYHDHDSLTLFPPKTNIFVHSKNCTFSKKGLGHKGRCYSVCNDDTCKWTSHIWVE